ncbi:hypothetical protein KJ903_00700 [Patescibacteria group bacterium]|nr:hypothetical protein [Patescibacteria group bacterium]
MKVKWGLIGVVALFMFLVLPVSAQAIEFKNGDEVIIAADQIIEDDLLVAGGNIRIHGQINGDLVIAGGDVEVTGQVNGDVLVGAGQVTIEGPVMDDVVASGGQVRIKERIEDNVILAGGMVEIDDNVLIGRDLIVGAGNVSLYGDVGRNIWVGAGEMKLAGEVGGNVEGEIENLSLTSDARINGDLKYSSTQEAQIDSGAEVAGVKEWTEAKNSYSGAKVGSGNPVLAMITGTASKIISGLGLLIIGILFVLLFPRIASRVLAKLTGQPGASFGWGLLVLIATPIAAVMVMVTIVGFPLALLVFVLYSAAIYLAKVIVGLWIGDRLIKAIGKKQEVSLIWSVGLGLVIFGIVVAVPFIGWLVKLVAIAFGLGAWLSVLKGYMGKGSQLKT